MTEIIRDFESFMFGIGVGMVISVIIGLILERPKAKAEKEQGE